MTLLEMFSGVDLNSEYVVDKRLSQNKLNELVETFVPTTLTLRAIRRP